MCQRAETIVYTISTNTGPSKDKGDDVLQAIADATGGQAFFPTRMEDVAVGFRSIEVELRSQYSLVYVPANFQTGRLLPHHLPAMPGPQVLRPRQEGLLRPQAVAVRQGVGNRE